MKKQFPMIFVSIHFSDTHLMTISGHINYLRKVDANYTPHKPDKLDKTIIQEIISRFPLDKEKVTITRRYVHSDVEIKILTRANGGQTKANLSLTIYPVATVEQYKKEAGQIFIYTKNLKFFYNAFDPAKKELVQSFISTFGIVVDVPYNQTKYYIESIDSI